MQVFPHDIWTSCVDWVEPPVFSHKCGGIPLTRDKILTTDGICSNENVQRLFVQAMATLCDEPIKCQMLDSIHSMVSKRPNLTSFMLWPHMDEMTWSPHGYERFRAELSSPDSDWKDPQWYRLIQRFMIGAVLTQSAPSSTQLVIRTFVLWFLNHKN